MKEYAKAYPIYVWRNRFNPSTQRVDGWIPNIMSRSTAFNMISKFDTIVFNGSELTPAEKSELSSMMAYSVPVVIKIQQTRGAYIELGYGKYELDNRCRDNKFVVSATCIVEFKAVNDNTELEVQLKSGEPLLFVLNQKTMKDKMQVTMTIDGVRQEIDVLLFREQSEDMDKPYVVKNLLLYWDGKELHLPKQSAGIDVYKSWINCGPIWDNWVDTIDLGSLIDFNCKQIRVFPDSGDLMLDGVWVERRTVDNSTGKLTEFYAGRRAFLRKLATFGTLNGIKGKGREYSLNEPGHYAGEIENDGIWRDTWWLFKCNRFREVNLVANKNSQGAFLQIAASFVEYRVKLGGGLYYLSTSEELGEIDIVKSCIVIDEAWTHVNSIEYSKVINVWLKDGEPLVFGLGYIDWADIITNKLDMLELRANMTVAIHRPHKETLLLGVRKSQLALYWNGKDLYLLGNKLGTKDVRFSAWCSKTDRHVQVPYMHMMIDTLKYEITVEPFDGCDKSWRKAIEGLAPSISNPEVVTGLRLHEGGIDALWG